jgi:sensor histidine kinase YesM
MVTTYWFSVSITKPVKKLTLAAKELSKGRFDQQIDVKSRDEIAFLAQMFERMRVNIVNYIEELNQKAQLERELQQNKLLLQESQLLSLQSQINPHFLFNTLDLLSKKAFLEGAEETSDLLVNVAGLLRYNLKHLDRAILLRDEVQVLMQYMEIQKTRFSDLLQFESDIDDTCLSILIPGLTLQPLIENAVIYAVEKQEDGGSICFRVRDGGKYVIVQIEDNGPGIPEEKIQAMLAGTGPQPGGHTTGIGFRNVVDRLKLFYGRDDVLEMHSVPGQGTTVQLTIPKQREEAVDV